MDFSLDRFYQLNRRILLWIALFALIWLLRDFFPLIFLVFVLSFLAAPLSRLARRWLRLPHALSIVAVYACFLVAVFSFVRFVAPRVIREAETLLGNLGQIEATLFEHRKELADRYPYLDAVLIGYLRSTVAENGAADAPARWEPGRRPVAGADPEAARDERVIHAYLNRQMARLQAYAPEMVKLLWRATGTTLLALLFSFLILLDTARLKRGVDSLRASRLHDFYEQTAEPVVRFGYVVGRAVQAQTVIATANTALTVAGLLLLGVPSVTAFAVLVFLCSFIPVLGVFLSTTPIVLVALNAGGVAKAAAVVGMVVVIHLIEAYLLNPLIYGRHLNVNPVFVLIILYVGHHVAGVWGMVLGVPVTYYLLHDALGVPLWDRGRLPERGVAGPAGARPGA